MPRFNRAYRGLYGNRMIQFGNQISFAENKTRRTWKPNVQKISFFSDTLQKKLQFRITTHALRCVKKAGGIDEYLLKTKDSEIKYYKALEFKTQIKVLRAAMLLPKDTIEPHANSVEDLARPSARDEGTVKPPASTSVKERVGLQQLI